MDKMTREEAIKFGKRVLSLSLFDETHEFCEIAVKALEQEPELRQALEQEKGAYNALVKNIQCADCISRQAVVDMTGLSEWFDSSDSYNKFVFALSELPPVTPQPCKVSEYDKDHIWYKGSQYISLRRFLEVKAETKQEPCDDAISRQAVLDLPRIKTHNQWGNVIKESVDIEDVRQLPPVTPAEKVGQCENIGSIYKCPCGYGWDKNKVVRHHFCPNCGRKVQEVTG